MNAHHFTAQLTAAHLFRRPTGKKKQINLALKAPAPLNNGSPFCQTTSHPSIPQSPIFSPLYMIRSLTVKETINAFFYTFIQKDESLVSDLNLLSSALSFIYCIYRKQAFIHCILIKYNEKSAICQTWINVLLVLWNQTNWRKHFFKSTFTDHLCASLFSSHCVHYGLGDRITAL